MIEAGGGEETSTTSSSNSVTFAICSESDEEDLDEEEDYVEDHPGSSPKEDSVNQGSSTGCPIWIKVYNLIRV